MLLQAQNDRRRYSSPVPPVGGCTRSLKWSRTATCKKHGFRSNLATESPAARASFAAAGPAIYLASLVAVNGLRRICAFFHKVLARLYGSAPVTPPEGEEW